MLSSYMDKVTALTDPVPCRPHLASLLACEKVRKSLFPKAHPAPGHPSLTR